jgi:hypothetical protein
MANTDRLRLVMDIQARGFTLAAQLLIRQLVALWRDFDKYYDGDLVAARAARSATMVDAAADSVRRQTESYLRFTYQQFDDLAFPSEEEIDQFNDDALDRLVNPLDEWNRPAEQFRFAESQGKPRGEAIEIATKRVEELADLDLALAMRNKASNIFKATPKVTGYRRVIHPELSQSGTSCGLCIAASTRVYGKEELLPLHDHCHCTVMPIIGDDDPGDFFNQEDIDLLNQLYQAAGGNDAQSLSRTRFKVIHNSELGPYLVEEGSKTKGNLAPGNPRTKISRSDSVDAQIKSLTSSLERLLNRQRMGEDVAEPIVWQQDRLRLLKKEQELLSQKRRRR